MTYTQQDLSPYSSHVLARRAVKANQLDREIEVILELAMIAINDVVEMPTRVTNRAKATGSIVAADFIGPWRVQTGIFSAACVYEEERPVTWLPRSAGKDKLHHLLMVTAHDDGVMALTTTDAQHRVVLSHYLRSNYFADWKPIPQAILLEAMIQNEQMKTLWLAGIHRDTVVKPSSKILSGFDLRDAVDPMNDSSYVAGAVRSSKGGVSLRNSSVWTGQNADLQSFENRMVTVLKAVNQAIKANPPADLQVHSSLARLCDDITKAKNCYFISHPDPEALDDDSGKAKAKMLAEQFRIELSASGAPKGKPRWAFAALLTHIDTQSTAVIEVEPKLHEGTVSYDFNPIPAAPFDEWVNAMEETPNLLRVHYESGHTIANSTLTQLRMQDSPFNGFVYGDFNGYQVTQEKPPSPTTVKNGRKVVTGPVPIQNMMTLTDKSLFKWIFKEGLHLLKLNNPSPGACWLYCDDGSSEIADFIHLDTGCSPKRLTLIHAKGAASNKASRLTAPGPYELVCSQAIKNLRAFDAEQLLDRIKNRLKTNGANRIWDQPWQVNLLPMPSEKAFESALSGLGANYDCEVIIVQPHVRQTDFISRVGKRNTVGARQLRTLLFGVESLARAVNARFRVVADKI